MDEPDILSPLYNALHVPPEVAKIPLDELPKDSEFYARCDTIFKIRNYLNGDAFDKDFKTNGHADLKKYFEAGNPPGDITSAGLAISNFYQLHLDKSGTAPKPIGIWYLCEALILQKENSLTALHGMNLQTAQGEMSLASLLQEAQKASGLIKPTPDAKLNPNPQNKKYSNDDILKLLETHLALPGNAPREKYIEGKPNPHYAKRTAQIHTWQTIRNITGYEAAKNKIIVNPTDPLPEPYTLPQAFNEEILKDYAILMANLIQLGINKCILDTRYEHHVSSYVHHEMAALAGNPIPQKLDEKEFLIDNKTIQFAELVAEARAAKGLIVPAAKAEQNPPRITMEEITALLEKALPVPADAPEEAKKLSGMMPEELQPVFYARRATFEIMRRVFQENGETLLEPVTEKDFARTAVTLTNFIQLAINAGLEPKSMYNYGIMLAHAKVIPDGEVKIENVTGSKYNNIDGVEIKFSDLLEQAEKVEGFVASKPYVSTKQEQVISNPAASVELLKEHKALFAWPELKSYIMRGSMLPEMQTSAVNYAQENAFDPSVTGEARDKAAFSIRHYALVDIGKQFSPTDEDKRNIINLQLLEKRPSSIPHEVWQKCDQEPSILTEEHRQTIRDLRDKRNASAEALDKKYLELEEKFFQTEEGKEIKDIIDELREGKFDKSKAYSKRKADERAAANRAEFNDRKATLIEILGGENEAVDLIRNAFTARKNRRAGGIAITANEVESMNSTDCLEMNKELNIAGSHLSQSFHHLNQSKDSEKGEFETALSNAIKKPCPDYLKPYILAKANSLRTDIVFELNDKGELLMKDKVVQHQEGQNSGTAPTGQPSEKPNSKKGDEDNGGLFTGTNMALVGGLATALGGTILTTSNRREMQQALQDPNAPPPPQKSWVDRVLSLEGAIIGAGVVVSAVAAYKKWGSKGR